MDEGQDGSVFVDHSFPLFSSFRDGATGRSCSCSTRVDFLRGNCTDPIGTDLRDLPPSNEIFHLFSPDNKAIALWSSNFVVEENSGDDSDDDFFYHFRMER